MVDVVSPEKRSEMMSGIKGKDTKPEILVRKALYSRGFRYRLHDKALPGKPDLVLKKYNVAIQIHGCFWHGHSDCHLFRYPKSKQDFWREKIGGNIQRDRIKEAALMEQGWRFLKIWECALKGKKKLPLEEVISKTEEFILSDQKKLEIRG